MCGAPPQPLDTTGIPAGETVVQGHVLRDGDPVAGAYVRLLGASGEFTAEVVTSATGIYRFFARPGSWRLRVLAPGNLSGSREVLLSQGAVEQVDVAVS